MKNIKVLIAAMIAAFMLQACNTTNVGVVEQTDEEYREYLVTNSSALASKVTIVSMKSAMVGNMMRVQAELKNNKRRNLSFQYKFKFFDQNGMELATDGRPWTPIVINGGEVKSVQATAPDPRAVSYKIYVQD